MITESKKIRTRTGTTMMFATLDDLDGAIEIVVFEKALDAVEKLLATDAIVLVRGRVDHKEAGKSCVIVQDAERFDPSETEIEKAKEQVARLGRRGRAERPASPRRRRAPAADRHRGAARPVRPLSGRRRVRARDAHARRRALPAVRRGYKIAGRNGALCAELDHLLGPAPAPVAAAA